MRQFDFLIIGSGMAGASAAFELAASAKVLVAEREDQHGYHTTGRSAAIYAASYGNTVIRRITAASRAFFDAPPAGFADYPLLTPRGSLYLGAPGQEADVTAMAEAVSAIQVEMRLLDADDVRRRVPILKPEHVAAGVLEPGASDIDVHALHTGFLRGAQARGATLRLGADLVAVERQTGGWRARFADGESVWAGVVINAAGAWADVVARAAEASPIGLTPLRRTAMILDAPSNHDCAAWPALIDIGETFYFKPEAGRLLASPADETPSEPCDAYADDMDVAICVDRIQTVTDLPVRRVLRSWAGLRTFAPDRSPVIGFDPDCEGFFWLAGQGGYGVQTAPAAGRLAASLALGRGLPGDLADRGVTEAELSPGRFGPSA